MALTETQKRIYAQILLHTQATQSYQIVYISEWLGWPPFGVYHWINDSHGKDLTKHFPAGWERSDIAALEHEGLLRKIKEWRNPSDEFDYKITYEVVSSEG